MNEKNTMPCRCSIRTSLKKSSENTRSKSLVPLPIAMNFFEPKLKLFCSQSTKVEEQCSLNDLLKMYMCVKTISKNLDDYDHIKLITEEEPLQVIVRITMSSAQFFKLPNQASLFKQG